MPNEHPYPLGYIDRELVEPLRNGRPVHTSITSTPIETDDVPLYLTPMKAPHDIIEQIQALKFPPESLFVGHVLANRRIDEIVHLLIGGTRAN